MIDCELMIVVLRGRDKMDGSCPKCDETVSLKLLLFRGTRSMQRRAGEGSRKILIKTPEIEKPD